MTQDSLELIELIEYYESKHESELTQADRDELAYLGKLIELSQLNGRN